jgi:hypothetical protein
MRHSWLAGICRIRQEACFLSYLYARKLGLNRRRNGFCGLWLRRLNQVITRLDKAKEVVCWIVSQMEPKADL